MDPVRAKKMSESLLNEKVGGWTILRHINSGKSAVVFESEKDGKHAVLKIFDPELVERFGKDTQLERIKRELILIDSHHPNLVEIFDGGECQDSEYLYIAMEFIDAPNLGEVLEDIPREKISIILQQVASAAFYLEQRGLAHRDIKPENIAITSDYTRAVLLDLGVLRPFGQPGLTDDDARIFVGTLRYSSPEFLLRTENDTVAGWRAVTFYQLGAVLHDLIMRQPVFNDFSEPYALLVEAVKNENPILHANDVPPDLVVLAQNCLVKKPSARLSLVKWDDFESLTKIPKKLVGSARERVRKRALQKRLQSGIEPKTEHLTTDQMVPRVVKHLDNIIRKECTGSDLCPPMEIIPSINSKIQVRVIFASSGNHTLPNKVSVQFDCEIVDTSILALNVFASACVLRVNTNSLNPPCPFAIFSGPLDSDVLTDQVQNIIWTSLDLAQRQFLTPESPNELWLDLKYELEG